MDKAELTELIENLRSRLAEVQAFLNDGYLSNENILQLGDRKKAINKELSQAVENYNNCNWSY